MSFDGMTKPIFTGKVTVRRLKSAKGRVKGRNAVSLLMGLWLQEAQSFSDCSSLPQFNTSLFLFIPLNPFIFIDSVVMTLGFFLSQLSAQSFIPSGSALFFNAWLFSQLPSLPLPFPSFASFWTALAHCSCRVLSLSSSTLSLLSSPLASNHHCSFENRCPGCGMFVRQKISLPLSLSDWSLVCRSLSSPNFIRFRFNKTDNFIIANCVQSTIQSS